MHVLIDLLYEGLYWSLGMLFVFTHGLRVSGARRVPRKGPVLIIANHESYLDIIASGFGARRRVRFLARQTLATSKVLAFLMRMFDNVPVDNVGFSRTGLTGILDRLQAGHAVVVFPEGERCWDGKLGELKPGVTLLIKKAKVPVVPIGLAGVYEALPRFRRVPRFAPPFLSWSRSRMAVYVGKPLDGARLAELPREEMLQVLQKELEKVVEQAERLRGNR